MLVKFLRQILIIGIISSALYFIAQHYFLKWQYPQYTLQNLQDSSSNSLIESGYIPSWLPSDAQDIYLQIGLEQSMAWWLRFQSNSANELINYLGFSPSNQPITLQLPSNNDFFFKTTQEIKLYEGKNLLANKKEYLAIKDNVIYYWVQ